MALTTEEQQELQELESRFAPKSTGLSPEDALELNELEKRFGDDNGNDPVNTLDNSTVSGDFRATSVIEPLATVASSIVAEPLAGLSGIAQTLNPFADEGAGARAVEAVRNSLTYTPRTDAGKETMRSIAEFIAPAGEVIHDAEKFLGDKVFETTGSPTLAAASASLPTAMLELIGLKGAGKAARGRAGVPRDGHVMAALKESAPSAEDLRKIATSVYKEIDDAGVSLKPQVFKGMIAKVEKSTKGSGISTRVTPHAVGIIEDLKDAAKSGKAVKLSDIEDLRTVAQGVAGDIVIREARLGSIIVDEIDDFLDGLSPKALQTGNLAAKDIAPKYKIARNLYGRAKKSELVQGIFKEAEMTASGFENGMRIELRKIFKSPKKSKFFSADELDTMRAIVKGNFQQNTAKLVGKLGFSGGINSNVIGASLGMGGGAALSGMPAAAGVVTLGTASKIFAYQLTKGRVQFADDIIRAGKDGMKIADAYLTAVPKSKRVMSDLTDMLSDPTVDLSGLFSSAKKNLVEAAEIAAGRQIIGEHMGLAAASAAAAQGEAADTTASSPIEGAGEEDIALLKGNPDLASEFDDAFGAGAADNILNPQQEVPEEKVSELSEYDIAIESAQKFLPKFGRLSPGRKEAVANLSYQMGYNTLSTLTKFRTAMVDGDFRLAARELVLSSWYKQTQKDRSRRILEQILKG